MELFATEADGSETALLVGVVCSTSAMLTSKQPMTSKINGRKSEDSFDCNWNPPGSDQRLHRELTRKN